MWKALKRAGERVPRCRVQRLMRANGIVGAKRRGKPWRTTKANPQALRRPDLVQRDFTASLPNNNARLHESLGDIPPVEYEQRHTKRRAVAASLRSPYGLAPRDGDAEHEGATTLTIESTRPN
jgi:transposase InsO family protein